MSEYICNAPLKFSGKDYAIGDVVPDGIVIPKRARTLIVSGHLTEVPACVPPKAATVDSNGVSDVNPINIPINTENGSMTLTMSPSGITAAISIVQLSVEGAIEKIRSVDDDDVLILLHSIERRKGVLKAIEERHAALAGGDMSGKNV